MNSGHVSKSKRIRSIPDSDHRAGGRRDILKIDTEGCERAILSSLKTRLPTIQVIYVEYHSNDDRIWIDAPLSPTHILSRGQVIHEHQGDFATWRGQLAHQGFRPRNRIVPASGPTRTSWGSSPGR
jgi:Methyltransferase FkbM domain